MDTEQSAPQAIYLKDYTAPYFHVDSLDLEFELLDSHTVVKASSVIRPDNTVSFSPNLILDGEDMELHSIRINGKKLDPSEYTVNTESLSLVSTPRALFTLEIIKSQNARKNAPFLKVFLIPFFYFDY